MTRENKVGLAVCGSFLCLVGVVTAFKLREPSAAVAAAPDRAPATAVAAANGDKDTYPTVSPPSSKEEGKTSAAPAPDAPPPVLPSPSQLPGFGVTPAAAVAPNPADPNKQDTTPPTTDVTAPPTLPAPPPPPGPALPEPSLPAPPAPPSPPTLPAAAPATLEAPASGIARWWSSPGDSKRQNNDESNNAAPPNFSKNPPMGNNEVQVTLPPAPAPAVVPSDPPPLPPPAPASVTIPPSPPPAAPPAAPPAPATVQIPATPAAPAPATPGHEITIPAAAVPPPAASVRTQNPTPPAAVQVDSWDERAYVWKRDDTFASVSKSAYGTEDYAGALAMYNRAHPRAGAALRRDGTVTEGERIYVPPSQVLERRHADSIAKSKPKPVATGTGARDFGPIQAGFPSAPPPPAGPPHP